MIPELLRALANEFEVALAVLSPETTTKLETKRKQRMPDSPEAKAVHAMMRRMEGTMWSKKEIELFCACVKTGTMTLSNIELIGWYRSVELPKGERGFCRRKLETLLAHWTSEIDAAMASPEYRRREKASAKPRVIVPMEVPTSDERRAELAAEAARLAKELRGA